MPHIKPAVLIFTTAFAFASGIDHFSDRKINVGVNCCVAGLFVLLLI